MKVAIIIPTLSNMNILLNCLHSIKKYVMYPDYHLYIADTGSTPEEKQLIRDHLQENWKDNSTLLEFDFYHFGKVNNEVVRHHIDNEDYLIFMNNDIELLNDGVSLMVDFYKKNEANLGTLGARLHFNNGTLQHAGQRLTKSEDGHLDVDHHAYKSGDIFKHQAACKVIGNTAAFMGIDWGTFMDIGMFPEHYAYCYEDLELNINCLKAGRENWFLGHVAAMHKECATRKHYEKDPMLLASDHKLMKDMLTEMLPVIPEELITVGHRTMKKSEWGLKNSIAIESEFNLAGCFQYIDPIVPENFVKQKAFEERYDLNSDDGTLHVLMMGHNSGCGKVRIELPAKYLNRIPDITAFPTSVLTPELLNWAHLFVWEGGVKNELEHVRDFLAQYNIPQVFEVDDNYLNINNYNKALYYFDGEEVKKWLSICNQVTVTKPALGKLYQEHCPDMSYTVLPNCIDFEAFPETTGLRYC